jgi:hypothetical protein
MPATAGLRVLQCELLPRIDWQQPWLAPYRDIGKAVQAGLEHGQSVALALDALRTPGCPRFVASEVQDQPYESFIARTGSVPTRDNLHDLFNGLVWLRFPALKRRLNVLHAREIERHGIGTVRGAVRDALTLFDENGALLAAPPALLAPLAARDWTGLFVAQRSLWGDARLVLVGHALLEKLIRPRKTITAHVWQAPQAWAAAADDALDVVEPSARPFAPLPVLGVPGWCAANEAASFYADAAVFRPAGSLRSTDNARQCRS